MSHPHNIVVIVGVGLLGASLGVALKARGLASTVRGVGRRQQSLDVAQSKGAIDESTMDLEVAVKDADLVVLCTPPAHVRECLDELPSWVKPEAVVTDVASTKKAICAQASRAWPAPRRFVGSHPMAGSEKFGPEHADANLFEGAVTFVEQNEGIDADAHLMVKELWQSVGSSVVEVNPDVHDELVARTSHVPHVVAAALAQSASTGHDVKPFVGAGFRDTTRVAEGRPEVWRDICLTNRAAIVAGLRDVASRLETAAQAIENDDGEALERYLQNGLEARRKVLGE